MRFLAYPCAGYPCCPATSGDVPVLMVEPAQYGHRDDRAPRRGHPRACRSPELARRPLVQVLVRSGPVEVGHELRQGTVQLALAKLEEVVDALTPDAAEEPLADG